MRRSAAVLVALSVALCAYPATAPAVPRQRLVRLLRGVRKDVSRPSKRVGRRAHRQDRQAAAAALRAAKRGRYCAVVGAVGRINRIGRAGRRLRRVDRLLRRSARGCKQRATDAKTAPGGEVSGGGFPADTRPKPLENEQGERDEVPPLPIGPFHPRPDGVGEPVPAGEAVSRSASAFSAAVTDPLGVFTKTALTPFNQGLNPLDPSEATGANVVLITGNTYLQVSTDSGKTFTKLTPSTIFKDSPDGGICCDQVMQYDPATDRFFWVIQYWCSVQTNCKKRPGENRYRIAVASPQTVTSTGGTGWKYWDVTSKTFGLGTHWLDFPDTALGAKGFYLTFNSPSEGSATWVRFMKQDLRDTPAGQSVGLRYLHKKDEYVFKPVQRTASRAYVIRRKSTSELEVKYWDEDSIYVHTKTVGIPTPATQNCATPSPDGKDFLAPFGCAGFSQTLGGAARATNGDIWVGWTAGRRLEGHKFDDGTDKNDGTKVFDQAHIELSTIKPDFTLKRQRAIWNANYAFSYPYLTASPGGEVAMTYLAGGNAQYPGWGVALVTNTERFARIYTGTAGSTRMGDYLAVRPVGSNLFSATGNAIDATKGFAPYYVLFGRTGNAPPPPLPPAVTATPKPSPSPTPTPTPKPPADLVISELTPSSVTVENRSDGPAGPFQTSVVDSQNTTLTLSVPNGLAARASVTLAYDCLALLRSRTATADSGNVVAEADESNNTRSGVFACGGRR